MASYSTLGLDAAHQAYSLLTQDLYAERAGTASKTCLAINNLTCAEMLDLEFSEFQKIVKKSTMAAVNAMDRAERDIRRIGDVKKYLEGKPLALNERLDAWEVKVWADFEAGRGFGTVDDRLNRRSAFQSVLGRDALRQRSRYEVE